MNKLSNCIINKDTSYIPIWFMRQAGRYLPEFREIRKNNQDFIKLCLSPKLVEEITLQPTNRFDLDAAIIFSDILMIPYGLGQQVKFEKGKGPILGKLDINSALNITDDEFIKKMSPVYESIRNVKRKVKNKSVIGFVGAPWTLLVYMLNQQSPKRDFNFNTVINDNSIVIKLLKKIEEIICLHIDKQTQSGADIVQIFDSWAGLLPKDKLSQFCFAPNQKIIKHTKNKKIPTICFPRGIGKSYRDFCHSVKPDCINIDYEVDPNWAKANFNNTPIQGGLDPKILLKDNISLEKEVQNYLNIFKNYPYIFNLGHGVLPDTKPETIDHIVKIVRRKNEKRSSEG